MATEQWDGQITQIEKKLPQLDPKNIFEEQQQLFSFAEGVQKVFVFVFIFELPSIWDSIITSNV